MQIAGLQRVNYWHYSEGNIAFDENGAFRSSAFMLLLFSENATRLI